MSSDGRIIKADKDFSKQLDEELPELENLAKTNLEGALERLSALEKQTRQAADLPSTERVLVAIVTICRNATEWRLLGEEIQILSKKHGQLKQATTKMIQTVIGFLDEIQDQVAKVNMIETIRSVTEGKIFVENERARVTRMLAKIKEKEGDVAAATELMTELQVETYGSMDPREKTEFILEQVELCIRRGDFPQASILSRKITTQYLKEEAVVDLRIRYYELVIQIALHEDKYLDTCKYYYAIYETPQISEDPARWKPVLENIVYYVILTPYNNEQSDLIHRIGIDPHLQSLPMQAELIKSFTTDELMRWPKISETYGERLKQSAVFGGLDKKAVDRWDALRKRVIEHNIRVISKYYTRISSARLNSLLDLEDKETERYISDLVTQGTIYARISRPEKIVTFAKPQDADGLLNEWAGNISSLLGLVENLEHLITKEEMMNVIKSS